MVDSDNASECFPELIRSCAELCTLQVKANMVSHVIYVMNQKYLAPLQGQILTHGNESSRGHQAGQGLEHRAFGVS